MPLPGTLDGPDTALARLLHRRGRIDVATLQRLLLEVRDGRAGGLSLANLLVERGLVQPKEMIDLVLALRTGPPLEDSYDGTFSRPPELPEPEPQTERHVSREGSIFDEATQRMTVRKPGVTPVMPIPVPNLEPVGPGSHVGPWVIEEQIGAGGMGAVYRVQHENDGGIFALKTIHAAGADPEDRARLLREAEAHSLFDTHRNVVRVRGAGEHRGTPFIVVELAEGGSLHERLRRGTLSIEETVRVCADVARGLEHLHGHGVIHRDLKPGNILFDEEGVAKLVDFGLARFQGARSLTESGTVIGTMGYLAPELAKGSKASPSSDVWALGCLIHTCLTGGPPFGHTPSSIDDAIHTDPPPLRAARHDVPMWLEHLYKRALAKEPAQRPPAGVIAQLLEMEEPTLSHRRKEELRRGLSPFGVALVLLAGVALGAGGAAVAVMQGYGPERPTRVPTPPSVVPTPAPVATTPASEEPAPWPGPLVWALQGVTHQIDAHLRVEVEIETYSITQVRDYWFVWDVKGSDDPRRVEVSARLRRTRVATRLPATERRSGIDLDVDTDDMSATDAAALRAVLNQEILLVLDPRTGRTLEVGGATSLQDAVYEKLQAAERLGCTVSELASRGALQFALNSVADVYPAGWKGEPNWRLLRDPPVLGQQSVLPEVDCAAKWREEGPGQFKLSWYGERLTQTIQGSMTRKVEGEAVLESKNGLVTSRMQETWTGNGRGKMVVELRLSGLDRK